MEFSIEDDDSDDTSSVKTSSNFIDMSIDDDTDENKPLRSKRTRHVGFGGFDDDEEEEEEEAQPKAKKRPTLIRRQSNIAANLAKENQ